MALDDLLTLAAGLPAHTHWVDAGRLHAIVPTSSWAAAMGVFGGKAHTVVHSDYQQVLEAEKTARAKHPFVRGKMVNDTFYAAWRDLAEIDGHMDYLRSVAPPSLRIDDVVIGETYEGRTIRGVRLSSPRGPGSDPPPPTVMMNGCHHSGEWITAMGTVYFFEQLVLGYEQDPAAGGLRVGAGAGGQCRRL